jgi:hypothetical protein
MKIYSAIFLTLAFFLLGTVSNAQDEPKPKKEISISLNFSFVDFTVDEAVEYLSSKYNVQFSVEMIGKKKIYNVEPKKK